ncbi:hypothetical protein VNO77_49340 [Canavalia gladiata]|uniref:Uncharacterized protein n=1 Tax=Canavalia gladiata TaxID=3824 RepID=A0AAN9JEQ2_CANGL
MLIRSLIKTKKKGLRSVFSLGDRDQLPSQSDACLALSNSPVSQASQADHLVQGFQSEYFQQNVCLDRASNHLDPMIHLQVILCESARQGEKDMPDSQEKDSQCSQSERVGNSAN